MFSATELVHSNLNSSFKFFKKTKKGFKKKKKEIIFSSV